MKKWTYVIPALMAVTIIVPPIVIAVVDPGEVFNPKPEPKTDWYNDDSFIESLAEKDIGTVLPVKVNGSIHKIRLIDVDKDELSDGSGKAHTTWEFVDVISDRRGFSLTTFWNDSNEEFIPCGNYLDSSLRWALVGLGRSMHYGWYERTAGGNAYKSTTYTSPVIDMLPSELVQKIKPVRKEVCCYDPINENFYSTYINDKLFLLSSKEMCCSSSIYTPHIGTPYSFYEQQVSKDPYRHNWIKRQVGVNKYGVLRVETQIADAQCQLGYKGSIAGYNNPGQSDDGYNFGTGYWLRDICPDLDSNYHGMPAGGSSQGDWCYGPHGDGNLLAACVAPCFCI